MADEDIQIQRSEHRIAQAVLLDQEPRVSAWQRRVPPAPFIDHQRYFLWWVIFIHDRRMLADQILHL